MEPHGRSTMLQQADGEVARRDARIDEMARAHARLQWLYEISKLLTRFESVQQTLPDVLNVTARVLPLRSSILTLELGNEHRTISWLAEGEDLQRLREAETHAGTVLRYLGRTEATPTEPLALPRLPAKPAGTKPDQAAAFVTLPLAVNRRSILGALQIEAACELDEQDLVFVNAVVNQLSVALDHHSADEALRASEAKLEGLVSTAADAIVSVDESQRIVMYNECAEKVFGWSRAEALGETLDLLLPERLRDIHRQHVPEFAAQADVARKMGAGRATIVALRKNGEEFPAEATISKLKVGGEWLFTVILRDVSEQKRIEDTERFLGDVASILATTLDFKLTVTGIAQVITQEFADWCIIEFVDDQDEIQRVHVAASDADKSAVAEALRRFPLDRDREYLTSAVFRTGQPQLMTRVPPADLRGFAQNEEHRNLLEAVAPESMMGVPLIVHGRLLGALTVMSSHPERRYGTADLRLLEEVGRRSAFALQNARLYRALSRAVQMRDDVLGIVAHDLRSPLNSILMASEMLRAAGPAAGDRSAETAETILRSALRMDRLIQDLLDVARMEAGHLSIEAESLSAVRVVTDAVESEHVLASSDRIELRVDVPDVLPEVWADRDRLVQVFDNLIGNALKFTPPGGRVTVGAELRDEEIMFWVQDSGPGIAAADLEHLFDRFWQARKTGRRGAGLGLPIARGIVEAHGGRIWAESAPNRGSTFYCTIPTARRREPSQSRP